MNVHRLFRLIPARIAFLVPIAFAAACCQALAQNPGHVLDAATFPGADACVQIQNAIAALPSSGGVVDAQGFGGNQACGSNPFATLTKPVKLLFGDATFNVGAEMLLSGANAVTIECAGRGSTAPGQLVVGTAFRASARLTNLFHVLNSNEVTVENCTFDGNFNATNVVNLDSTNNPSTVNINFISDSFILSAPGGTAFTVGPTTPPSQQIDAVSIAHSYFSAGFGDDLRVADSNARIFLTDDNFSSSAAYHINLLGGIVVAHGLQTAAARSAVFHLGDGWGLTVSGARCEDNADLLMTETISITNSQAVVLENVDHARRTGTRSIWDKNGQTVIVIGGLGYDVQLDAPVNAITLVSYTPRSGSSASTIRLGRGAANIRNMFQIPRISDHLVDSAGSSSPF